MRDARAGSAAGRGRRAARRRGRAAHARAAASRRAASARGERPASPRASASSRSRQPSAGAAAKLRAPRRSRRRVGRAARRAAAARRARRVGRERRVGAVGRRPPSPAPARGAGFEWPASTRVSYVLNGNYRGEVNGRAQVEWIRIGDALPGPRRPLRRPGVRADHLAPHDQRRRASPRAACARAATTRTPRS